MKSSMWLMVRYLNLYSLEHLSNDILNYDCMLVLVYGRIGLSLKLMLSDQWKVEKLIQDAYGYNRQEKMFQVNPKHEISLSNHTIR